jgi:dTMP kinase
MKKIFIVLEGIDGSGTSTQADLLKAYFLQQGEGAVVSPEPSDGPIGKLIRAAMQGQVFSMPDSHKLDEQMAYLFAADRHYHLYNNRDGVFKLMQQDGCHVITTRYYFSSLAYNCNNWEEFEFVSQLNQKFPNPDLLIYLDLPIAVSLSRLSSRPWREIYETEQKLRKVRQNYHKIFENYQGKILKLDGNKTINNIHQQIVNYIAQMNEVDS